LSFPRPGRSAPADLIELPSYHETYVTPGPTAVGARALILLLWRSPQMLEEERNHVSVEFLVERCAVEALPVGANRGHHLGEVRRTRGEKVEVLGIGGDVKIGLVKPPV